MSLIHRSDDTTISPMFDQSRYRIEIPVYQRPYSWRSNTEVMMFWQDLRKFDDKFPHGAISGKEYFIGSIIGYLDTERRVLELLDGQQRLATTTILLSVIRDKFYEIGSDSGRKEAEKTQDYILREIEDASGPVSRSPAMKMSSYDQEFFQTHIQEPRWIGQKTATTSISSQKTQASHALIKEAREFLDRRVQMVVDEYPTPQEKVGWLRRMRSILIHHLVLVLIEATNPDDATEIFETMNDRGRALTTTDLLRNYILMSLSGSSQQQELAGEHWAKIFAVSDRPTGVEQFLRHFWITRYGDVKSRGLYKEMKEKLSQEFALASEGNPSWFATPLSFSETAALASENYFALQNANSTDKELNKLLEEVRALEATAVWPLLLAFLDTAHSIEDLRRVAKAAISFVVRWSIVGGKESTQLEETLFGLARQVQSHEKGVDAVVRAIQQTAPGDQDFAADFAVAKVARTASQRHLLVRIEEHQRFKQKKNDAKIDPQTVHVEHIFPRKSSSGPLVAADGSQTEHDEWINRIGNLTLLLDRVNTSVKNKGFSDKIKEYSKSSSLLTRDVPRYPFWTEHEGVFRWTSAGIEQRQQALAEVAPVVWNFE